MAGKTRATGLCCGTVTLLLFLMTLSTPWYFISQTEKTTDGTSTIGCSVLELYSWNKIYCRISPINQDQDSELCESISQVCPEEEIDWRSTCDTEDCNSFKQVWNLTPIALGISAIATLLVVGEAWYSTCAGIRTRSQYRVGFSAIAISALAFAVFYFATHLPSAFNEHQCQENVDETPDDFKGPCNTFFGSRTTTSAGITMNTTWGGFGWIVALGTLVSQLLAVTLLNLPAEERPIQSIFIPRPKPINGGYYPVAQAPSDLPTLYQSPPAVQVYAYQ